LENIAGLLDRSGWIDIIPRAGSVNGRFSSAPFQRPLLRVNEQYDVKK